jgi:hypothetical protein
MTSDSSPDELAPQELTLVEESFETPPCPRCQATSSGQISRHGIASGGAVFDNYVITCNGCMRRSEEHAAMISTSANRLTLSPENAKKFKERARSNAIADWLGPHPND